MERPEAQDAGTIILTGFEPKIVLSSVRTVIAEHKQISNGTLSRKLSGTLIEQTITDKNSENPPAGRAGLSNLRHLRSIPVDYTITDTSWRVLKLILGNTKLSNKPACRQEGGGALKSNKPVRLFGGWWGINK